MAFFVNCLTRDVLQASGSCPEVYDCWKILRLVQFQGIGSMEMVMVLLLG